MKLSSVITNHTFGKQRIDQIIASDPQFSSFLNKYLENSPNYLNLLTGYFSPKVWRLVGDKISSIPENSGSNFSFRMVIGREVSKFDPDELQKRFEEELADAEFELVNYVRNLIRFLQRQDVGVKLLEQPFMHGKLYLFPNLAVVGSSNFTISGLAHNHELNLITEVSSTVNELQKWFEYYWSKGNNYKDYLIEVLNKSWLGLYPWTPFEVYTKIAFEYYKTDLEGELTHTHFDLASFQKEGVIRSLNIIEKQNGVLIADAVGLGKSFIGLETAYRLLENIRKVIPRLLIICPAQLQKVWESLLRQKNIPEDIFTMEMLSRELPKAQYDVILIDECHNFRRPTTNHYKNLLQFLGRNLKAKLIFLSATPINTDLMDLYYQLNLITREVDSSKELKEFGIQDLYLYFKELVREEADFQLIKEAFLVCRSRAEIRFRQTLGLDLMLPDGKTVIRFPDRQLNTLHYSIVDPELEFSSGEFYKKVDELLSKLKFPQFNWESYHLPEFQVDKQKISLGSNVTNMIQALFLKRLESSLYSFKVSIENQLQLLNIFLPLFREGYVFSTPLMNLLLDGNDELGLNEELDENILLSFLIQNKSKKDLIDKKLTKKKKGKVKHEEYRLDDMERDIKYDIDIVVQLLELVNDLLKQPDRKLLLLTESLNKILAENTLKSESDPATKVLIFSYFRNTVDYLIEKLKDKNSQYYLTDYNIDIITGGTSPNLRTEKILAFSPRSNAETEEKIGPIDKKLMNIDVLLCTDVLSEGQNLQDANHIINYDLHWNPVRMIQRAGRIDRLKSQHRVITVHNFFVEDGLEELLGLMARITERLEDIDQTIELDGVILRSKETIKQREDIKRIEQADLSLWDEYEAQIEFSDHNPTKKTLQEQIISLGSDILKKRPLGIHSGKITKGNSGLIVAMQIHYYGGGIETRWIFEPDEQEKYEGLLKGGLIMNRREVENMLRCEISEPRIIMESEELFPRVKRIRDKMLKFLEEEYLAKGSSARILKEVNDTLNMLSPV
ncbi:MAG: RNA polymerase-associated protein RapA [Candidatus Heimdallarchaeota archaeon LC_3]|nr:MAG: RNA polymerase-associated protein RapA [Candidatus Heimdallarchaeota archaeon LC_3]